MNWKFLRVEGVEGFQVSGFRMRCFSGLKGLRV
jgi:hypothetical protein